MMQNAQIRSFYASLSDEEKDILCEALADDFYFLEKDIQEKVLDLLQKAEPELSERIKKINGFTMR